MSSIGTSAMVGEGVTEGPAGTVALGTGGGGVLVSTSGVATGAAHPPRSNDTRMTAEISLFTGDP